MHQIDTTDLPIGTRLKLERTLAGASLTDIAKAVGVSIGQLSRIESGARRASDDLVQRIREAVAKAKAAA